MKKRVSRSAKKQPRKKIVTHSISVFRINLYTTGIVFSIVLFAFTMYTKQQNSQNVVLGTHTVQPVVTTPSPTPTPTGYPAR